MKERYFTQQLLEQQASQMLQEVTKFPPQKGISFHPGESALLVLDMQEYFLAPASHAYIPSAEAIIGGILRLIDAYASLEQPTIFTQHINSTSNAGMMSTWWSDLITTRNPFHRIIPQIDVSKGRLVQKSQYDAFYQTGLGEILHQQAVQQVVICGVMTHLCCETTARSAFMRGYHVFFPVDGTATYNREFHRASLINLAHGFSQLVLVKDILEQMRGDLES